MGRQDANGRRPGGAAGSGAGGVGAPGTDSRRPTEGPEGPVVQKMFLELQKGIAAISAKLDDQTRHITGLQTAVDGLKSRQADTAKSVEKLEQVVQSLGTRLQSAERMVEILTKRADDLEDRSRRNNVRLVGIPESATKDNLSEFVEDLIKAQFGTEHLSPFFVVERAHRTLAPVPKPGEAPRPILIKFLNFRDRDTVLRMAREKEKLYFEGAPISFYPDFALNVQNAQRAFNQVKKVLCENEVQYAMLFPAKLRIVWKDSTRFFMDPQKAAEFVAANVAPVPDETVVLHAARRHRRRKGKGAQRSELRLNHRSSLHYDSEDTDAQRPAQHKDTSDSESLLPT